MKNQTIVDTNGSKWNGQKPDSISKLLKVLASNTLREDFFEKGYYGSGQNKKKLTSCPIYKHNGMYRFFGNFEEVSHPFLIETNDDKVISQLKVAIQKNAGWDKYIANLHKKYTN